MSPKETFNSVNRFSNRVENYIKYRPHYPVEIIDFLNKECGFDKNKTVADIGSGPGISTEHFIANGNTVYAVEPNAEMRKAAEEIFRNSKNFISINGTAEVTTLQSNSIDFIISGQAFHWFDRDKCKIEFKRIIKDNGYTVLIWNEKISSNDFMKAYYDLLEDYGTDYGKINHAIVTNDETIGEFYSPQKFQKKIFENKQLLDYTGLEGRLLSSSYIPLEGEAFDKMIAGLRKIFDKYSVNGKTYMEYETRVYYGKM